MKLNTAELTGLLIQSTANTRGALLNTQTMPKLCGREIARANELNCVIAVSKWGHLRIQELARAVWPTAKYAEQLAGRTARRLVKQGLLLERRNSFGGRSLCLTRAGVAWLELRGIEAQHTLDLTSVSGPTFFHRALATQHLLRCEAAGRHVAGEYLILRRKLPFSIEPLTRALKKLPDGLAWSRQPDGTVAVEVTEVEAASKARQELERCLRAAEYVGINLPGDTTYKLSGLVFVFDGALSHARRILLAANSLWGDRPAPERIKLEKRVRLVAVELRQPLVWIGQQTITLHEFRLRGV